jgi:tetratricopeptide (TPR) repeat protein
MIIEGAEDLLVHLTLDSKSFDITPDANHISTASSKLEMFFTLLRSLVQFQRAIQQIQELSLARHESHTGISTLRIHDLIKILIQEQATRDEMHHRWFHVAVALAHSTFQRIDDPTSPESWLQCEMLSPHIHALTTWGDEHAVGNSQLSQANFGIARYLRSRGRYGEAEILLKRVLVGNERILGPDHRDTLQTIENLAIVYRRRGKYEEAETLYKQAQATKSY